MTAGWHVVVAADHTTAVLVRGALRAEGLRAELDRDGLGAVYGLSTGGHATRVLVPDAEAPRARAVLDALDAPPG